MVTLLVSFWVVAAAAIVCAACRASCLGAAHHRRGRVRARHQALRRAAAGRAHRRARRRGRLPGAAAAARAGTSATGAGSTRSRRCRWSSSRPARSRCVVAADGAPIPPERILGREVACDNFQDAEAFLRGGGEHGRQLGILTAGTLPHQPGAVQGGDGRATPQHFGMTPDAAAASTQIPPDKVGIVTALDGRPIPAGDLAGPVGRRPRQLPARPGVHRRRRLPRPAGAGAAVGLVEPEPVVRAGRADAA